MKRSQKFIVCLLVLSIVIFACFGFAGCGDKKGKPGEEKPIDRNNFDSIKLMSFNIRLQTGVDTGNRNWIVRRPKVKAHVFEKDADIICFQEVKATQRYDIEEDFGDKYEVYWHWRKTEKNSEGLAVLYRKGMFEEIERNTFWLSPTPEKEGNAWGATINRICVNTTIKLKNKDGNGGTMSVYNVHLDHRSAEAQRNGLALVREKAKAKGTNAIICGDFNCNEDGLMSTAWIDSLDEFNDCRLVAKKTAEKIPTYNNYGTAYDTIVSDKIHTGPIDHILVDKRIIPEEFQIFVERPDEESFYSDHYAIMATLLIPKELAKQSK